MAFQEVRYNDNTKLTQTVKAYDANKPGAGNFAKAAGIDRAESPNMSISEWKLMTSGSNGPKPFKMQNTTAPITPKEK